MAYQQTATYTKYQEDSKHQFSGLNHCCLTTPEYRPHKYNINNLTPGSVRTGKRTPLLDLLPRACTRTDHRSAGADNDHTWTLRGDVRRPSCRYRTGRTDYPDALSSPLSTASATAMSPDSPQFPDLSRRTDSLRRLTAARLSHSVGSSRRLRRPAKYNFAPSHTETTPISHGLKLEPLSRFDHKSCRPLLRASRTQSKSHLPLYFAIFLVTVYKPAATPFLNCFKAA